MKILITGYLIRLIIELILDSGCQLASYLLTVETSELEAPITQLLQMMMAGQ